MIFSSISFLSLFLPLLLSVYYLSPKKIRNIILLLFSLFFYYMGEKWYVLLLVFTCFVNYIAGLLMKKYNAKIVLTLGLIFNLGLLFYFKYTNFFLNTFINLFGFSKVTLNIILPLGISFFTFQNVSYLIDVYKKGVEPQKSFITYATYITLFPQLIAGPIVRYQDVEKELSSRSVTFTLFSEGVKRFIIGLSKKVLIADTIYQVYNTFLTSELSACSYLLIGICFTLQLYYDFSGYSDMAIGLGKMFGFQLKENFNYPLIASSITDFWRRWHISLSSFLKDYVYIPLGGNRKGTKRQIFNLLIVWSLTGLWHGADWNFILWGLYFFILLIFEKFFLKKYLKEGLIAHCYTFIFIILSFILFSIPDLKELSIFLKGCLGINVGFWNQEFFYYFLQSIPILSIALLGIGPWLKNYYQKLQKGKWKKGFYFGEIFFYLSLFLFVIASIVASSYHPFIYFRF